MIHLSYNVLEYKNLYYVYRNHGCGLVFNDFASLGIYHSTRLFMMELKKKNKKENLSRFFLFYHERKDGGKKK